MPRVLAVALMATVLSSRTLKSQASAGATPTVGLDAVPEAPAFTFLGVSPANVSRPTTPRDFGVALLNAVDSAGRLQQGFALNVTPWYFVPGFRISLHDYQTRRLKFILANTQLSLGTARAGGDSAATEVALGLRLTLLDRADPMQDTTFTAGLRAVLRECRPTSPDTPQAVTESCIDTGLETRRSDWVTAHWNATSVALAFATGTRLVNSQITRGASRGWSGWLSGSLGMGKKSQLLGQLSYDYRPAIDTTPATKTLAFGARGLIGSSFVNLFLEVVGKRQLDAPTSADASTAEWSGGIEFRAAPNLWLATGFGSTFATQSQPDRVVLIANMRWGVSSQARGFRNTP